MRSSHAKYMGRALHNATVVQTAYVYMYAVAYTTEIMRVFVSLPVWPPSRVFFSVYDIRTPRCSSERVRAHSKAERVP